MKLIDYRTRKSWEKGKKHSQKITQKQIKEKREQRKSWKNQDSLEDVCRERKENLKQKWNDCLTERFSYLKKYLKRPATGEFCCVLANDWNFFVEEINLGQYSSKCTYYQVQRDLVLDVPAGAIKPDIEEFDGIANIFLKKIKEISGITIYKAKWLKARRGFNYDIISGYIAEKNGFSYHSESMIKGLLKGLMRKIKRNVNKMITLDTEVTVDLYQKITGACKTGIQDWIGRNNITVEKMTVKELLPILEKTKAWGRKKLKSAMI